MMDRLENMVVMGTDIREAVAGIEDTLTVGTSFNDKGEAMHGFGAGIPKQKLDEFYEMLKAIEDSMTVRADSVDGKVDAMQGRMDEIKGVINAVENNMDDMVNKMDD